MLDCMWGTNHEGNADTERTSGWNAPISPTRHSCHVARHDYPSVRRAMTSLGQYCSLEKTGGILQLPFLSLEPLPCHRNYGCSSREDTNSCFKVMTGNSVATFPALQRIEHWKRLAGIRCGLHFREYRKGSRKSRNDALLESFIHCSFLRKRMPIHSHFKQKHVAAKRFYYVL